MAPIYRKIQKAMERLDAAIAELTENETAYQAVARRFLRDPMGAIKQGKSKDATTGEAHRKGRRKLARKVAAAVARLDALQVERERLWRSKPNRI
jgi:hypothetical protein